MDAERFDQMTRLIASGSTRRQLLKGALASVAVAIGSYTGANAAQVLRGPGQVCRKSSECIAGSTCERTSSGRSVCACGTGTKACGNLCISTNSCCVDAECDTCACQGCDPGTHACVFKCDPAAGEACADGICKTVCNQAPCSYGAAQCEGTGCTCRAQGKECLDCCCVGQECACGPIGSCAAGTTVNHCCCDDVNCDCSGSHVVCCQPGDSCTVDGCCMGPDGAYCFPAPIFAVRR